MVARCCTS